MIRSAVDPDRFRKETAVSRKKPPTPHQRRQRELAWMLYIIEGALANVHKASSVNCTTFTDQDKRVVNAATDRLALAGEKIRRRLQQIS